ncbi:DUF6732 family protein [Thalassorhabdomicrobium marinisediminis]|uniref:DUF6732 family protein n=1 Tax=Thalassorhabdomicrobium marinisediminis TaxID=2170577 RepID=UPI0024912A59|nr:DUF6732 family protein [Thalassorhabdomicrobium marinisediminis]
MRLFLTPLMLLTAGPALAHPGHLGELGGHDHWIALGGIAIAGAIALWGIRKKAKDTQGAKVEEDTAEGDAEDATA